MARDAPHMGDEDFELFNEFIVARLGIWHSPEKRDLLRSRLEPRLEALGLATYMDYYLRLQFDADDEMLAMASAVTNNDSFFFREIGSLLGLLEKLREVERREDRPVRVLCAGCAAGQEPYSLSFLARDGAKLDRIGALEIDAFDVDLVRLQQAIRGEYSASSLRGINEDRIRRCFAGSDEGGYTLRVGMRSGLRFFWGNLLDPSLLPTRIYDAVLCRNVMIYFTDEARKSAVHSLAAALRPGGMLVLGRAEMLPSSFSLDLVRLGDGTAYQRASE